MPIEYVFRQNRYENSHSKIEPDLISLMVRIYSIDFPLFFSCSVEHETCAAVWALLHDELTPAVKTTREDKRSCESDGFVIRHESGLIP